VVYSIPQHLQKRGLGGIGEGGWLGARWPCLVVAPAGRPDRPLRAGLAVASTHVGTRADTRSRHHAFRSVTAISSVVLVLRRRGRESITSGAFGRPRGDIGGEELGVRRPIQGNPSGTPAPPTRLQRCRAPWIPPALRRS